jgi:SAM-dependent methyltransferase
MDFSDLSRLASAHVEARIVQVAVSLRLFDALERESKSADAIASSLQCDSRATGVLLNGLVGLALLHKSGPRYSLTDIARSYLLRSSPRYLGGMILFDASLWSAWGKLEETVRSGEPSRPPDMYQQTPEETERFIGAMDSLVRARGDAEILWQKLDWAGVNDLLDVGSGPGTYPIYFCGQNPRLRATIFDLPATLAITGKYVREAGLADRIRLIPGDYRSDGLPGEHDLVLLSNIIHAESDQENGRLVRNAYACLRKHGRIVIKDHHLDDSLAHPPVGAIFSLLMLLTTARGRCYSFDEVRSWLHDSGFANIEQIDLSPPLTSSLIVGEKA